MGNKIVFCSVLFLFSQCLLSQTDTNTSLSFDFNDGLFKEINNRVGMRATGVTLTSDRFGNENAAAYLHGNATSYLNLGTSNLLKPKQGTISLWINLQGVVLAGKGYNGNPILIVKNGSGEDFIIGYGFLYERGTKRIVGVASKDSIKEVSIFSREEMALNKWYHLVITSDNNHFTFYINGELQGQLIKGFESHFFEGDSVILGRTTGIKNERYTHAIYDDIKIFHRVLHEKEIQQLYNEPNPNRIKKITTELIKYTGIILLLGIVSTILLIRNKHKLKRQKEYYELKNKIRELEAKAIRYQMNPHFISNSMAAIQNLIYDKEYTKASQYLAKSTFLMRQVLDLYDKLYITLEEELNFIKLNVELEQLRFNTDFRFEVIVDKGLDLKQVMVPALITQPIVENAIWHGLLPLIEREPRLIVHVYIENNVIYLVIEDDGVGRRNPSNDRLQDSKGIKLIKDKIMSINQLRGNEDFQFEIVDLFDVSGTPSGTKVIIKLLNYIHEE